MTQLNRLSVAAVTSLLLAAYGGDVAPPASAAAEITVSAATLDSRPEMTLAEGGLVCVGLGTTECPIQSAIANWLSKDEFAMWEPGRKVSAWRVGDTAGVAIGTLGPKPSEYSNPGAVAGASGGEVFVINADNNALMPFESHGKYLDSKALPSLKGLVAWDFAGNLPVLRRIIARDSTGADELELRILTSAGDSTEGEPLEVRWMLLPKTK